jgi:hypothetical protein
MVDTADGQADYDDEDPNMSDWGDFGDVKNQDGADVAIESSGEDESTHDESDDSDISDEVGDPTMGDEDDFMDADSDSDSDIDNEGLPAFADAEEYQEAVDESFSKLKRLHSNDLEEEEPVKKKGKKRRIRKN